MKKDDRIDYMVIQGDSLATLKTMPDECVNCVITSPPYYGQRDYKTATWQGGDQKCDHALPDDAPNNSKMTLGQKTSHAGRFGMEPCRKCGAVRIDSQIGLEQSPQAYVDKIVSVFREVRRVMRSDGTCWLVIGDSYAWGKGKCRNQFGLKPKDLIGIPWRVALGLQADEWWLRQDIIWEKTNPMPESVRDRCTRSHEYVFMLTKNPKYYFDSDAIKEAQAASSLKRAKYGWHGRTDDGSGGSRTGSSFRQMAESDKPISTIPANGMRNKRSVWTVATASCKLPHFASFPPKLIEPMVLAGCPIGGTILDPFSGTGTTGLVALQQSRHYIGIELNPEYVEMSRKRIGLEAAQRRLI